MKKFLVVLFLLVFGLSFSQENKRTLDEDINTTLDSLSKVYKKKVVSFGCVSYRGVKETYIRYIEDGRRVKEVIKTEFIGDIKKEDE